MKNRLADKPHAAEHGQAKFIRNFVDTEDLAGQDVLDIGCGFGWFELLALEKGADSVTGVEPSDEDLGTARRNITDRRAAFRVASADSLPFDDDSFDTVVMWEVLEHLPKHTEREAFLELARVLRPGGRLYLSTPHATPIARLTDPAWWLAGHRHYRPQAIARFAEHADLAVEKLFLRGGCWQVVYMLNLYIAKWIFRRPPFFDAFFLTRLDREWARDGGWAHIFLTCRHK